MSLTEPDVRFSLIRLFTNTPFNSCKACKACPLLLSLIEDAVSFPFLSQLGGWFLSLFVFTY